MTDNEVLAHELMGVRRYIGLAIQLGHLGEIKADNLHMSASSARAILLDAAMKLDCKAVGKVFHEGEF